MGKKEELKLDVEAMMVDNNVVEVPSSLSQHAESLSAKNESEKLINCLRNETIEVRHINRPSALVLNPKHALYGKMAENAVRVYVVPRLSNGNYVNILTDDEKAYLEYILGLEHNALSIYKKTDNFWDTYMVTLHKRDNYLDLSAPMDYISYKVLLANKLYVAPSLKDYEDYPKATYEYIIVAQNEEDTQSLRNLSSKLQAYMLFGKIEDNYDALKYIVEILDGRPIALNTKLSFLKTKVGDSLEDDYKSFLKIVTDEYFSTKIIINKAVDKGLIAKRDNKYYLKSDNSPLCGNNEEATINNAAKFLNLPKNLELLFTILAKINE